MVEPAEAGAAGERTAPRGLAVEEEIGCGSAGGGLAHGRL